MSVEYMTGGGVIVQQTLNQTELVQLLQVTGVKLLSVNRQRITRIRHRRKGVRHDETTDRS